MDDQQETIELRIIGYRKTKEGDVISFAIQNDDRQKMSNPAHHAFSIGLAVAPEGTGPPPPITGRLMLSGSGSGRSTLPRIGRITRKCKK